MSELTLMILRIGFLLLLWLFIFAIVYALRSDLFGVPVRKLPNDSRPGARSPANTPAATPPAPTPAAAPTEPARSLIITTGNAAGTTLTLDDDIITIGRSNDSTLVIVDEYTSTYHAKLARNGERWMLTDLDSTNGTKVNGSRIKGTVLLPVGTPVTIGTTTFELRP